MTTQPQTAWPENTVARFLTVGGAIVEVTHEPRYSSDTAPTVTVARCGGCPADTISGWAAYAGSAGADSTACTWAQTHAETCRALPKPA
ncbi:hypothetical protein [Streptomyces sp. sk226]|uniref:hypothetical protein n=1 Tax=Streptomyces sp. sk226 TaxID=2034268 RepID=UPI000BF1C661|nr:hypothetical protein [Streptomyces sp. sk226]